MCAQWSRAASAARFDFRGMKTNCPPDAQPKGKYNYAQNTRGYSLDEITGRPQLEQVTAPIAGPVLSLEPTIGIYKIGTSVYYAGAAIDGGYSFGAASILPFRPNASPNAWEYIWDDTKNRKVFISSSGAATVQNTGLIEPQVPVDAYVGGPQATFFSSGVTLPTESGVCGAPTFTANVSDTAGAVFVLGGIEEYVQVSPSIDYRRWEPVVVHGTGTQVLDTFPPIPSIGISAVRYYTPFPGIGRCTVVPDNLAPMDGSTYDPLLLQTLRRGSLVQIDSEVCIVLGTSVGPDGTISFETTTTTSHGSGSTLTGIPGIKIGIVGAATGDTIVTNGDNVTSAVSGAGTGTLTYALASTPFVQGSFSYQPDDYIHFSFRVDDPTRLNEIKFLLDVNNGAANFTDNYYYVTVRPSDQTAGLANTLTQLGVAQIVAQRIQIDEEAAAAYANQGTTYSSDQLVPGNTQWTEILIPISRMTRVGNDQTRGLQNVQAVQLLVNASAACTIDWGGESVIGLGKVDVGATGIPIRYTIRPRSTLTGVKGNPAPVHRYGVSPRRSQVQVVTPTSYVDSQMDVWDVYRQGAALKHMTYVGTCALTDGVFFDNFPDTSLQASEILDYSNYQPFPSIGPPVKGTVLIRGTQLVVTLDTALADPAAAGTLSQIRSMLPGTILRINQQLFTLYTRPTIISSTSLVQIVFMQVVENAGSSSGDVPMNIDEPVLAAQANQFVWGPDANGVFFAVGDALRPGFVTHTNPNNPDSADEKNASELCQPTEPLQNGVIMAGTSFVFSANRAWRGFPRQDGSYNWVEIPTGAGLAAPWAICSDGEAIFFWAKDGIRKTGGGASKSLTDEDLYNIFPTEGAFGTNSTYGPDTVYAPDYAKSESFRLAACNGYLFADYQDSTGVQRTLPMNSENGAWSVDTYTDPVTVRGVLTKPGSTGGTRNDLMYVGTLAGAIKRERSSPDINGEHYTCVVDLPEEVFGDLRASKLFGDGSFDAIATSGFTVVPYSYGASVVGATIIPPTAGRPAEPYLINLGGEIRVRSLGARITWNDYGVDVTTLFSFQYSYIPQPEDIANRFSDWDNAGTNGNKYFEGFLLTSDTGAVTKSMVIRDADTLMPHDFNSNLGLNVFNHNGQSTKAYSFVTPFVAHLVRTEPQGTTPFRDFGIKYIVQPTPEFARNWISQSNTHSMVGWQHTMRVLITYSATAPVTLSVQVDGVTDSYTLPATSGWQKYIQILKARKGLVHRYFLVSAQDFAVSSSGLELYVKSWGSAGGYENQALLGGQLGNKALV